MALTLSRPLTLANDDWRATAACQDTDPDLFFPVGTTGPAIEQIDNAKAVCGTCDAKTPCLEFEEERRKLRRAWLAAQRRSA